MFRRRQRTPVDREQAELIDLVPADLRERLDFAVNSVPVDFGGGSGLVKAMTSAALILRHELNSYVEIGVYRGRSLLPIGVAFSFVNRGVAVGIDPWDIAAATQHDIELFPPAAATVNEFVAGLDWNVMFDEVTSKITELGITNRCRLIRAKAADVASTFPDRSVGLLHIDGNHDESAVLADLNNYLPKLAPGGFVILDDASWGSVQAARRLLDAHHRMLFEDEVNDFAVYAT